MEKHFRQFIITKGEYYEIRCVFAITYGRRKRRGYEEGKLESLRIMIEEKFRDGEIMSVLKISKEKIDQVK